eukprot:scaffold336_cov250-Pinguiococcus_pyrenoidosus.AAC.5
MNDGKKWILNAPRAWRCHRPRSLQHATARMRRREPSTLLCEDRCEELQRQRYAHIRARREGWSTRFVPSWNHVRRDERRKQAPEQKAWGKSPKKKTNPRRRLAARTTLANAIRSARAGAPHIDICILLGFLKLFFQVVKLRGRRFVFELAGAARVPRQRLHEPLQAPDVLRVETQVSSEDLLRFSHVLVRLLRRTVGGSGSG